MHSLKSTIRNVLLGAGAAPLLIATAYAQDSIRGEPSEANHFIATPEGWEHPVTPWGEPDIQAMLNMMQAAGVPLERCRGGRFGGGECDINQAWRDEAEYNRMVEQAQGRVDRSRAALEAGDVGASLASGLTDPSIPQRQLSLIMDPPDGQLPTITEEGKRRALEMRSGWTLPAEDHPYDWATDFDSWDRCITRGMPSSMMPYRYNGGFRITQAPGYVILDLEMIHESRIVPTTGQPPLDSEIKQYMGESRGYWDGNTLVIETTNYKEGPPMINLAVVGSPAGNRFPMSDQMKTVERITRLNDEWWLYEITTEDPVVLERPFTVRYPMHNDPDYWWPEYACHEGNTIVHGYVTTSRYDRENPPVWPESPIEASPEIAEDLVGRYVGSPRLPVMDLEIEIEFEQRSDGTIVGKLIGTNIEDPLNRPLQGVRLGGGGGGGGFGGFGGGGFGGGGGGQPDPRALNFQFPNNQAWSFSGRVTEEGTIDGSTSSSQGSMPLVFHKVD